ncbi:MAG: hypothetical protein ACXVH2_00820 [Methanobacterium sp.]
MTNTEQLFIRACKSLNPELRVRSVYRRFYGDYYNAANTSYLLINICNKYDLVSIKDLIEDLNPDNKWKYAYVDDSYWALVMNILISKIRLTEISKLPELKKPLRFRHE